MGSGASKKGTSSTTSALPAAAALAPLATPSSVGAAIFAGRLREKAKKHSNERREHQSAPMKLMGAAARYTQPEALLAAVATGDVGLLSLKWLLEWAASGRPLPRRQELPEGALLTADKLAAIHKAAPAHVQAAVLPVIAVSYCWLTPQMPDPDGAQLRLVADILGKQQSEYSLHFEDMGVFWDWASIFQKDPALFEAFMLGEPDTLSDEQRAKLALYEASRSDEHKASFKRALTGTMDLWYAHQGTVVIFVTVLPEGCKTRPYDSRGWTTFERCSAELIKPVVAYVVEEGKTMGDGEWLWPMCIDAAHVHEPGAGRRPPAPPAVFNELLKTRQFTNNADKSTVMGLFSTVATAVLGATTKMQLNNMVLQPGDEVRIAEALAMGHAVEEVAFAGTPLEAAQVRVIFGEALPTVKRLFVQSNGLGEAGGVALAEEIGKGVVPGLQTLVVSDNGLGEAGGVALAEAIGKGVVPGLQTLVVGDNGLGEAGGVALAEAIGKGVVPGLQKLYIDGNGLGESGGVALAEAIGRGVVPRRGV